MMRSPRRAPILVAVPLLGAAFEAHAHPHGHNPIVILSGIQYKEIPVSNDDLDDDIHRDVAAHLTIPF